MNNSTESSPVRVGVIGTGSLGRHHARLYRECEGAELVGIYDRDEAVADKVAAEFATRVFASPGELMREVDGVSVATPTTCHFEMVKRLLDGGIHVLVEKPITETVVEARELVGMAAASGLILHVGHVERYNPVLECLQRVPGTPRFIEAQRLAAYPPPRPGLHPRGTEVSVVLDLMIHDLDVILHLVRDEVEQVAAIGVPILSPSEDMANVRLSFASGTVANLTASRVSATPCRRIQVFKNSAVLDLDYQGQQGEIAYLEGREIVREPVPVRKTNALQDELQDFVDCMVSLKHNRQPQSPRVTGEHGLEALKLADWILREIEKSSDRFWEHSPAE